MNLDENRGFFALFTKCDVAQSATKLLLENIRLIVPRERRFDVIESKGEENVTRMLSKLVLDSKAKNSMLQNPILLTY
jgi:polyhydroxyalkanoate synthesis regulator protein